MSKEAMKLALKALEWNMCYLPSYGSDTAMAINAMTVLREALAEQPAQQEPVWRTNGGIPRFKKPWIGLSAEDRDQHRDDWHSNIHDKEFFAIEAKLKEKNNG